MLSELTFHDRGHPRNVIDEKEKHSINAIVDGNFSNAVPNADRFLLIAALTDRLFYEVGLLHPHEAGERRSSVSG